MIFVRLHAAPSLTSFATLDAFVRERVRDASAPPALAFLIESDGRPPTLPTPEARRCIDAMHEHIDPDMSATLYVIRGLGLKGAAIRGVVRMVMAIRRARTHPKRIFDDLDEGLQWLRPIAFPAGSLETARRIITCIRVGDETRGLERAAMG